MKIINNFIIENLNTKNPVPSVMHELQIGDYVQIVNQGNNAYYEGEFPVIGIQDNNVEVMIHGYNGIAGDCNIRDYDADELELYGVAVKKWKDTNEILNAFRAVGCVTPESDRMKEWKRQYKIEKNAKFNTMAGV